MHSGTKVSILAKEIIFCLKNSNHLITKGWRFSLILSFFSPFVQRRKQMDRFNNYRQCGVASSVSLSKQWQLNMLSNSQPPTPEQAISVFPCCVFPQLPSTKQIQKECCQVTSRPENLEFLPTNMNKTLQTTKTPYFYLYIYILKKKKNSQHVRQQPPYFSIAEVHLCTGSLVQLSKLPKRI